MERIHASPTALCSGGLGEQTVDHVMQGCPEYRELNETYCLLMGLYTTNCMEPKRTPNNNRFVMATKLVVMSTRQT